MRKRRWLVSARMRITEGRGRTLPPRRRVPIVSLGGTGVWLGGQLWRFRVRIPGLLYCCPTGVEYGRREELTFLAEQAQNGFSWLQGAILKDFKGEPSFAKMARTPRERSSLGPVARGGQQKWADLIMKSQSHIAWLRTKRSYKCNRGRTERRATEGQTFT